MAKNIIHRAVRLALEKERWVITDDPFTLQTGDISVDIDLAAEKFMVAERGIEKILVEVKSFGNRSLIYDFHMALGQYIDYRGALRDEEIEIELFLAISEETFRTFERTAFFLRRIQENGVKLLVVNLLTESIVLWQK